MDADEREIYYYLKPRKDGFISVTEISRHAGSKGRFRVAPEWAFAVVARMLERGILEFDGRDGYRIKPIAGKGEKVELWASPKFAKLLKDSGRKFANFTIVEDEDEYYDKL